MAYRFFIPFLTFVALIHFSLGSPAFGKDLQLVKTVCGPNTSQDREKSVKKVCLGKFRDTERNLVVLEMNDGSTRLLEEAKVKQTGYGEQEFGDITVRLDLVELDENDKRMPKRKSKATIHTTWEYSDGLDQIRGRTYDKKSFDAFLEQSRPDETLAGNKTKDIFTCHVSEKGEAVKVQFGVQNMGTRKAGLLDLQPSQESDPILISPKRLKSGGSSSLEALNAQGGDLNMSKTRLILIGDDDGVTTVHFILYKNSDYKKGYVRVSIDVPEGEKDPSWYSKVSCERVTQ